MAKEKGVLTARCVQAESDAARYKALYEGELAAKAEREDLELL
jgi:hypothetical protein